MKVEKIYFDMDGVLAEVEMWEAIRKAGNYHIVKGKLMENSLLFWQIYDTL